MVDEYQDVNSVQDEIFRALSRDGNNLFMVGDVKQSIYRFRLADPLIFTDKYEKYAFLPDAREGEPVKIMLQENFRSRREVIDGINGVFEVCMSKKLGEVDYDENAQLKCGEMCIRDRYWAQRMDDVCQRAAENKVIAEKYGPSCADTALSLRSVLRRGAEMCIRDRHSA